jgi:hypothetical protein
MRSVSWTGVLWTGVWLAGIVPGYPPRAGSNGRIRR